MANGRGGSQGAQSTIRGKNRRTEEAATTIRLPWRGGGQVSLVVLRIALLALASARTYLSGGEQRRVIVRTLRTGAGGKRNASRAAQPAILAHFVMLHQCPTTACPTTTILLRRATVPPCAAADSRGGVSSG